MPNVTGLEGIVAAETEIGHVDGKDGVLIYRGYLAGDLAVKHSYEEAAYLLWNGRLPDERELAGLRAKMAEYRRLPEGLRRLLDAMPEGVPLMNAMAAAVNAMNDEGAGWPPTPDQAIRITALLPVAVAYLHRRKTGEPWEENTGEAGHVAHYLRLLFGKRVTEAHIRAMNAYMILGMEHGLNASTFTARAESVLRGKLENGERLMGFGHRIYTTKDPRAVALGTVAEALAGQDGWLELARHVERTAVRLLEEYKPGRKLHANVEFYAAAVMRAIDMPPELFTPTFSAARAAGWTAHVLEQAPHNRIFRPQSKYVGPMPRNA